MNKSKNSFWRILSSSSAEPSYWEFLGELIDGVRGLFANVTAPLSAGFTTVDASTLLSSPKARFWSLKGVVVSNKQKWIKRKIEFKRTKMKDWKPILETVYSEDAGDDVVQSNESSLTFAF